MLDEVTSRLTQHLADVAEAIAGSAEELGSAADVHRGVVRDAGDREFELVDLVGDRVERLEMRLAPGGRGRHGVSPIGLAAVRARIRASTLLQGPP